MRVEIHRTVAVSGMAPHGACRRAAVLALGLAVLTAGAGRADELMELVNLAFRNSPVLQAARAGLGQADAAREAVDEFLDPSTLAAGGRTTGGSAPPLLGDPAGLPVADAYGASARLEVPVRPGVYAGAGVSEQYLLNPPTADAHLYRTLAGAQLRVPLLQDRGFSLWKADRARLSSLREAALARLLEAFQTVRHSVEQAYIDYLEALANAATSAAATDRALHLLQEAEELVRI